MSDELRDDDLLEEERGTYAISREEVLAILEHAGGHRSKTRIRNTALVWLMYATGIRVSEALSMQNRDLELGDPSKSEHLIRVRRVKKRPAGQPKDPKERRAWGKEREKTNRARVESITAKAAKGSKPHKADLARLELQAYHLGREPWDLVDRGRLSKPITLQGPDGLAAADALRAWLRIRSRMDGGRTPGAPLFPAIRGASAGFGADKAGAKGKAVSANSLRAWLKKVGEKAGIGDRIRRHEGDGTGRGQVQLHPHHFRHGAAVREYQACGGELERVREFLGHSNLLTTEKYLRGLGAMQRTTEEKTAAAREAILTQLILELLETAPPSQAAWMKDHLLSDEARKNAAKAARRAMK